MKKTKQDLPAPLDGSKSKKTARRTGTLNLELDRKLIKEAQNALKTAKVGTRYVTFKNIPGAKVVRLILENYITIQAQGVKQVEATTEKLNAIEEMQRCQNESINDLKGMLQEVLNREKID